MRRALFSLLVGLVLASAACSEAAPPASSGGTLVIAVNAPFSKAPYIGDAIFRGVSLAVDQINESGGVRAGSTVYELSTVKMDNALSARKAIENVRTAVEDDVIAIVDEGTGVDASWRIAHEAGIPIGIVYQGGMGLVDPETKPNVYRVTTTDRGIAFRFAEYLLPQGFKVAFLHDDSSYGQQGKVAFDDAFGRVEGSTAASITIPSSATDIEPQVLEAKRSHANALLVWARPSVVAEIVRTVRGGGWDVPIYSAPSGADPLVRQQLSDHPEWVDGLTFASGRMTAEKGPEPFLAFAEAYHAAFGRDEVGVQTSDGRDVFQPPEYPMYPYDFVRVLAAAVTGAGSTDRAAIQAALEQVDVQGANGDERGFNEKNHEGVVDDDVYFAEFRDMTFSPVKDDPLSATLPVIPQT